MARSSVRGFSGARLRRRRTALGMTGEEAADLAGVSQQAWHTWEAGVSAPSPANLHKVACALRVDAEDLITLAPRDLRLSDLRALSGLTQSEAGKALGVSSKTLATIERGRREKSSEWVKKLAALYERSQREVAAAWDRTRAARAAHLDSLHDSGPQ